MLFRDAEVYGVGRADVAVDGTVIAEVGVGLDADAGEVIECSGAALVAGLHDHHCHLLAYAAAAASVQCGPPAVRTRSELAAALSAWADGWVRGVGYSERVAGDLDRYLLDALRDDVPVRLQHRSGALWVVNSLGITALGLDDVQLDGVERDADGRPTGRLWRLDGWLRSALGPAAPPDLATASARLASFGITGLTDATPDLDATSVGMLMGDAVRQHVVLLGAAGGTAPTKIVVADSALPDFDVLAARIEAARPRPVAMHCVTRVALVLTLAALRAVGAVQGDRIEHAAVAPPDLIDLMRDLGLTVVTQPSLPYLRGDDYLSGAASEDRAALWPFRSLLDAGVAVGCSSDAPYGDADPWTSIAAAVTRRTVSGQPIGLGERVTAEQALRGYLTQPDDPGGSLRRIVPGAPADLVLLDRPLAEVFAAPSRDRVAATMIDGRFAHRRVGSIAS